MGFCGKRKTSVKPFHLILRGTPVIIMAFSTLYIRVIDAYIRVIDAASFISMSMVASSGLVTVAHIWTVHKNFTLSQISDLI